VSEAGERTAAIERRTKESDVRIEVNLDGTGDSEVSTGIPFFDHMLASFARHGLFDLRLTAKGDLAWARRRASAATARWCCPWPRPRSR
jgi:imidazoleglycerol phosphate dehydratase HisB